MVHPHPADPSRWHQVTTRTQLCKEFRYSKRSLSSSRKQGHPNPPPRLSRRAKVDLAVIVAGAVGSWLYLRDSDWDRDAWKEKERLLTSSSMGLSRVVENDTIRSPDAAEASNDDERLPLPIQKYLQTAMPNVSNRAGGTDTIRFQAVSVDQTGTFFASQHWYPFHSNLLLTTPSSQHHQFPGFVWEAAVSIMGMPNRVLETYIKGQGSIITKAWGKVPLIQVEEEEPYILFWLAMAPLIPSSFDLPLLENEGKIAFNSSNDDDFPTPLSPLIVWNSVHDLCTCSGTLIDRSTKEEFEMEFQFDPNTHLLQSIKVTSPSLPYPWQVQYTNYQMLEEGGVLVPSQMNVGKWKDDGQFELHLKITNKRMHPIAVSSDDPVI